MEAQFLRLGYQARKGIHRRNFLTCDQGVSILLVQRCHTVHLFLLIRFLCLLLLLFHCNTVSTITQIIINIKIWEIGEIWVVGFYENIEKY